MLISPVNDLKSIVALDVGVPAMWSNAVVVPFASG